MQRITITCLLFLFIVPVVSGQTFQKAVDYLDFLNNKQREILESHMSYTSAVAHGKSARKVEKKRKELEQSILGSINTIKALPAWNGDGVLRDSTVAFLQASYHVINEDYAKIVNLEEVAEQSYDAMEAYIKAQDLASEKINAAHQRVREQTKIFAKNNNINLIQGKEDELDKKVAATNKVMNYHREVFLIHFKASNQERYLVEAMNKKDLNALEQSRNALEKYSQEGLVKLAKVKPFNADNSIVDACRKTLQFYIKEAKEQVPAIQDFYTKQENLEKIKKALDAKGSSRTQADIDAYNKSIKDFNATVEKYNQANTSSNKMRAELNDNWNNSVQKFFDKHIPKH